MAGFHRAVKTESKLRLALCGPAGSGKTYTALLLATALADGQRVAVIDTERGSASKYADQFAFDVLELDEFDPDHYSAAMQDAVAGGYAVVVLDSLSHAWNGRGGLLEQVEGVAKLRHGGNSFKAWGDAEIRRKESGLIAALTGLPIHVIGTMRSKTEYVVEQNERGKAAPRKVGMAPVQRDGMEYEFDIVGEMTADNELIVQKTRCPALAGAVIAKPDAKLAKVLREWLHGAANTTAQPAPVVMLSPNTARKTSGSPSAPPASAEPESVPTIAGLRLRLKNEHGVRTLAQANEVSQAALHKDWEDVTEDDAQSLAEWMVREARDHAANVAAHARVSADALTVIETGAPA